MQAGLACSGPLQVVIINFNPRDFPLEFWSSLRKTFSCTTKTCQKWII